MKNITFDDAELFFQDFHIGTLTGEIEFRGNICNAAVEKMHDSKCAIIHAPDLIIHFFLKEKSPSFTQLINNTESPPSIKQLLSDFGTLQIMGTDNVSIYINDVFWIRYPVPEFQIKCNSDSMLHSLYFLWN